MRIGRGTLGLVLLGVLATDGIDAQPLAAGGSSSHRAARVRPPTDDPNFGTTGVHRMRIGATQFDRISSSTSTSTLWSPAVGLLFYQVWISSGFPRLYATPSLPGGSLLTGIELDACDDSTVEGEDVVMNVHLCSFLGECEPAFTTASTSGFTGCSFALAPFTPFTVDNFNDQILIEIVFGTTGGSGIPLNGATRLAGVILNWKYQVSPAPVTATFADVPPGSFGFQQIEALVSSGITAGCGGGNYCPNSSLTRAQMAVFLATALGLFWGGL